MSDDIKLIHTNFYVYIFYDHRKSGKIYNLLNDFPVTFEHEPFYVGISQRNNRIEVHINDAIRLYKKDEINNI